MTDTVTVEPPRITVYYGRKINKEARGAPKYENEEAGIHVQADTWIGMSAEDLENEIQRAFAVGKKTVHAQLGLENALDEMGVIRELESKLAAKVVSSGPRSSSQGTVKADKTELWKLLQEDYQASPQSGFKGTTAHFYDNRGNKRNPQAPDWKHKDSGEGLWANSAPEWFGKDFLDG